VEGGKVSLPLLYEMKKKRRGSGREKEKRETVFQLFSKKGREWQGDLSPKSEHIDVGKKGRGRGREIIPPK